MSFPPMPQITSSSGVPNNVWLVWFPVMVHSGFAGPTALAKVEVNPMNMVASAIKMNFFMIPQSVIKSLLPSPYVNIGSVQRPGLEPLNAEPLGLP